MGTDTTLVVAPHRIPPVDGRPKIEVKRNFDTDSVA